MVTIDTHLFSFVGISSMLLFDENYKLKLFFNKKLSFDKKMFTKKSKYK
jgi:hypothetical protein